MKKPSFIVAIADKFERIVIDNRNRHAVTVGKIYRQDGSNLWGFNLIDHSGVEGFCNEFRAIRELIRVSRDSELGFY